MRTTPGRVEVAITGLGLVSALGIGVQASLEQALAGRNAIRAYRASWSEGAKAPLVDRVGGVVQDFDPGRYVDPRFAARYDPAVGFALAAAQEALADARLEPGGEFDDQMGCILGAGLPGAELWHRTLHRAYASGEMDSVPGWAAISITGNSVTSLLALRYKLRGPSFGIANACASGATAISLAADQIRLGRAQVMLAGGTEASARSLLAYASFAAAGGMHVTGEPHRACRPFSRDRQGFVLGEGSGILVLERLEHARNRGARIHGLLLGEAHANDAHHIINPDPTGAPWARAMGLALQAAGVSPEGVDVISAHAAGTEQGDAAETRAIKQLFGSRAREIPVSATKSMHGHTFGASGAVETVLALAALHRGRVLPTINWEPGDPECDLDYVPQVARESQGQVLLKNSFGAGGTSTCLVLRRISSSA